MELIKGCRPMAGGMCSTHGNALSECAADVEAVVTESHTDCRTDEGVAVGLLDGIIANLRVLRRHYELALDTEASKEALKDLLDDEDLKWLLLHDAPACMCGTKSYSVIEGGGWTRSACCGAL